MLLQAIAGPATMHIERSRMIFNLVVRGAIIMLFAMGASVTVVAWISTDLTPDLYRRSIFAALLIPMLISPPVSLMVGRLNYRYYLLHCKAEWLAEHDELTNLYNRRAFRTSAVNMLGQQGDTERTPPVVLMLIDIDHFKRVNDSLGHNAGDEAIRHVARILTTICAENAVIARLGGDEFAILTNWSSLADTRSMAASICHAVENSPCIYEGEPIALTLSLGVAIGSRSEDISEILHRADTQLYNAKDEGRNAYSIASTIPGPHLFDRLSA